MSVSRRALTTLVPALYLALSACGSDKGGAEKAAEAGDGPTKAAADPDKAADLVLYGGRVLTMDMRRPEMNAVAIKDGKFVALGTRRSIEEWIGDATKTIDLKGGTAIPGLTDAHAHLIGLGADLEHVDLRGAKSVEEVVERIKKGAPESGWVIGRGWDQNLWPEAAMPTHDALSAAFPDRPVWLTRVDGHAAWVNQVVLELAKLGADTKDPEGGELLRTEEGGPTGVLIDAAMNLVELPQPSDAELERQLLAAQAHVTALGLTGVHEMGVSPAADRVLRKMRDEGKLKLRIQGYASEDWFNEELKKAPPEEHQVDALYELRGVKIYIDGALGSRGAALLKAYSDRPGHKGALMKSPGYFNKLTEGAMEKGWQVAAHAIGDRGNRVILDAYALADQRFRDSGLRPRIEHAQILHIDDIPRFAKLHVIASMQPTHATSDMPWVPDRVGEARLKGAYAWQRLIKSGAHLAFGSDFPVELADPRHGLYAAVTRADAAGKPEGGWLPDQKVRLQEALMGFTSEAAYAARREEELGKIKKGYAADMTVFSVDLDSLEPAALRSAPLRATIVAGELVWEAKP